MPKMILFILVFVISSCGKNAYLQKKDTRGAFAVVVDDGANPDDGSGGVDSGDDGSGDDGSGDDGSGDDGSGDDGSGDDGSGDDGSGDDGSGDDGSGDGGAGDDGSSTNTQLCSKDSREILSQLSGEWTSGCQRYVNGHSLISNVIADDTGGYKLNYQLFKGVKCQSPEAQITYDYEIKVDGCLENSDLLKVNFISKSTEFTPQSASYTNYLQRRSECGIRNWNRGQSYDLTGKKCTFLLSTDPFHDTYRKRDEIVYSVLKVKSDENYMHLPDWTSNSGDSEEERIIRTKETPEYILRKI